MALTYEPIATTTISGSPTEVSFTSISSAYTDLVVVCSVAYSSAQDLYFRLNDDANNNYSYRILYGTGTTAGSANNGSSYSKGIADYYGTPGTTLGDSVQILHFQNYANTNVNKTILARGNRASGGVDLVVNLWRSTAAINKITFGYLAGGAPTFVNNSTITIYGIKAA